jgi:hypothetical protein
MVARRVTVLEHEEALTVCAKIKAKHPDIDERLPNGLYRYMASNPDMEQVLFDFLACDRVAAAWAAKKKAREADLTRLERAVETY